MTETAAKAMQWRCTVEPLLMSFEHGASSQWG